LTKLAGKHHLQNTVLKPFKHNWNNDFISEIINENKSIPQQHSKSTLSNQLIGILNIEKNQQFLNFLRSFEEKLPEGETCWPLCIRKVEKN